MVNDIPALLEELKKYDSDSVYIVGGESIYRQMLRGKKFNEIPDLMTFIIKTKSVNDVYKVAEVINDITTPLNQGDYQIKDYISHPKYVYFRGFHTYNIVESDGSNYLFHFQIQTTEMWRESVNGITSKWNYDVDDSGAKKMKESLAHDFLFYDDLRLLIDEYKKGNCSEIEFNSKVKHLILPRLIYIDMGGFKYEETYDGSDIKDFIIRLSRKGKIGKIVPNQEYYINGVKKDLYYRLKDGDSFEIRVHNQDVNKDDNEMVFTRKREK